MTLHERIRDHDYDPTCFGCKASTVGIAHSSQWAGEKKAETKLSADLAAYKRLRRDGVQPASIRDAADLEARASHRLDVDVEGTQNPLVKHMSGKQKDEYVQATKTLAPLPDAA